MAQYIDKDALVAEIEKHLSYYKDLKDRGILSKEGEAAYREVRILKSDINTLEVKEVDSDYIKDELDRVVKIYKPDGDFGWGTLYNIATHFFELGLKVQKGEDV